MLEVAPSILSADFAHLEESCRKVLLENNRMLHFDVMDGEFVPNISFGMPVLKSLKKAIPDAVYDVHLMIRRPHLYIEEFAKQGADFITFHIEADSPVGETIQLIQALGCKAGISLRPGTPVEDLYPYLAQVDMVLVMSVEPGFGGQSFQPEAVGRIRALRQKAQELGTDLLLQVDGGIDEATGPLCAEAGVDILVAGSTVFGAENPAEMVKKLKTGK